MQAKPKPRAEMNAFLRGPNKRSRPKADGYRSKETGKTRCAGLRFYELDIHRDGDFLAHDDPTRLERRVPG